MSSAVARFLIRAIYPPSVGLNRVMCALGIWNPWDWVDDHLLLGAVPARRHVRQLANLGISAIVNMCDEFPGHEAEMAACGVTQFYLPVVDYYSPDVEVLERGVQFIRDRANAGQKTYLHCKAGQGRSATLALCYLMAAYNLPAAEAFARVQAVRPHIVRRLDQRPTVQEFARRLAAKRSGG
jgi:atypical dual specificity phosphatase